LSGVSIHVIHNRPFHDNCVHEEGSGRVQRSLLEGLENLLGERRDRERRMDGRCDLGDRRGSDVLSLDRLKLIGGNALCTVADFPFWRSCGTN